MELTNKFLILGPGRTGSQLIANALQEEFQTPAYFWYTDGVDNKIIHSHDQPDIKDKSDWILIISRRYDQFKGAISQLVADTTKEWSTYSNKQINPVYISTAHFKSILETRQEYYNKIDMTGYASVVDIYFEDVLQYPYYLFEKLGIPNVKTQIKTEKSPYGREIISNYSELEKYWLENY